MRSVVKTFGEKVAVRDLDLHLEQGGLYGFIGPNGAGKTTTIRMMMGIYLPDRGEISVLGRASALDSRDRIGYLPEERGLYRRMRVGALLTYLATLKGVPLSEARRRTLAWLARLGLADCERKRCQELSKGMQQKVQFIAALIHDPELIILDEPFSGLDPVNARLTRELMTELHRHGRTILFSTHVMEHAEQICDHVIMIHEGRKVLDAPVSQIGTVERAQALVVEPLGTPDSLARVPGVREVRRGPRPADVELMLHDHADVHTVMQAVLQATPVRRIEAKRPSLEDVFIEIVCGPQGHAPAASQALRAALRPASGETSGA